MAASNGGLTGGSWLWSAEGLALQQDMEVQG